MTSLSKTIKSQNLMNPKKAKIRYLEKEKRVLQFLKDEMYSIPKILGQVMEIHSLPAIHRSLKRMQAKEVIQSMNIHLVGGVSLTLWSITEHGMGLTYEGEEHVNDKDQYQHVSQALGAFNRTFSAFNPKKIPYSQLQHTLDIQSVRVTLEAKGWHHWVKGDRYWRQHCISVADAIAVNPQGLCIAIEIERTLKSSQRYAKIIGNYLSLLNQKKIDAVYYFCPTQRQTLALKNLIYGLKSVYYEGHWGEVDASYFENFQFLSYENK